MKKAIVGIGIPGSGKSTVLKAFAEKNAYIYLCPDNIRAELTGDAGDQTKENEVWEIAHARVMKAAENDASIVFDATFANTEERKSFLNFLKSTGFEKIQGIYIKTPLETAKERNAGRERKVPEQVLERMHSEIANHPPEIADGFDTLFTLNENQEIISVERKRT